MGKSSSHCSILVSSPDSVNLRDIIRDPKLGGSVQPSRVSHGFLAGCAEGGGVDHSRTWCSCKRGTLPSLHVDTQSPA